MTDMGVTHYFPFGYEACSTGGYCETDQKSWLKEGEFTVVVLINIHVIKLHSKYLWFGLYFGLLSTLVREAPYCVLVNTGY